MCPRSLNKANPSFQFSPYRVRDVELPGDDGWREVVRERRNSSAIYRWIRMLHLMQHERQG